MSENRIYLDWNATAPIAPEAVNAFSHAARSWANPSSVHADGRAARGAFESARERLAANFGCDAAQIIFTSGGTEALGLALHGSGARRWLISAVEHGAVGAAVPDADIIPVDSEGRVRIDALERMLPESGRHALIAVMHANNETGVIQPIDEIVSIAHAHGARVLVDAVQTVGKLPFPSGDYVCVSAHKFGGPPGVGALVARCASELSAVLKGGGQERGLRGGTENLPGVAAMSAALDARMADTGWVERARALRGIMEQQLKAAGAEIYGENADRLPTTSMLRMPGVAATSQLIQFDLAGISVSSGSACSSGKVGRSQVLAAMGVDDVAAAEAIRVSLGWTTSATDIELFCTAWEKMARKAVEKTGGGQSEAA